MTHINRQPAGRPDGGQFAPTSKADAGVSLPGGGTPMDRACQYLSNTSGTKVTPATSMEEIALQGERYEIPGDEIGRDDLHIVNIESDFDTGAIKVETWVKTLPGQPRTFTLMGDTRDIDIRIDTLSENANRLTMSGLMDLLEGNQPRTH